MSKNRIGIIESVFGPTIQEDIAKKEKYDKGILEDSLSEYSPEPYKDPKFSDLRTYIDSSGKLWFDGQELCSELGFGDTNYRRVIDKIVSETNKRDASLNNMNNYTGSHKHGGLRHKTIVNTKGFLEMVMQSEEKEAEKVRRDMFEAEEQRMLTGVSITPKLKDVIVFDPDQLNRIIKQQELELERYREAQTRYNDRY